jgi:hypothetical protein
MISTLEYRDAGSAAPPAAGGGGGPPGAGVLAGALVDACGAAWWEVVPQEPVAISTAAATASDLRIRRPAPIDDPDISPKVAAISGFGSSDIGRPPRIGAKVVIA